MDHIGEVYEGVISGVQEFGIFAQLDNTCEGLIKTENLKDDYYIYNPDMLSLIGKRTNKRYMFGDRIKVEVVSADKDKSEVEIVSGRAVGADRLGERYAEEHDLNCIKFEAKWFELGRRAGIVRNGQMAEYASEDYNGTLFAFWNGMSKGTKNMDKEIS